MAIRLLLCRHLRSLVGQCPLVTSAAPDGVPGGGGTAPPVKLVLGREHEVDAALGSDSETAVCKHGHDLSRELRRKLRLVAMEQDSLALLLAVAVAHQALAAFTAIQAVP